MIIGLLILGILLMFIGLAIAGEGYDEAGTFSVLIGTILFLVMLGVGAFHGFVSYPATEGAHAGTLTAVDKEGIIFNHYRVYLKSSVYTEQGDETEYCVYLEETELVNKLKEYIGKQVKLHYSHKGGYIGVRSCGTYHIDNVELIEE